MVHSAMQLLLCLWGRWHLNLSQGVVSEHSLHVRLEPSYSQGHIKLPRAALALARLATWTDGALTIAIACIEYGPCDM